MSSNWDAFSKDAQKGSNDFGDNDGWPTIAEGTYHAVCARVGEPYDKPNPQNGEMRTRFVAEFALSDTPGSRRLKGQEVTIPSFITLPPKFLDEGTLSEKATLYKVMKAFGYDMDGQFHVNPPQWAEQGYQCDVVVENSEGKDGETSWITKFLACGCEEPEEAPPPPVQKRQPVGAGLRNKLDPE